MGGFPIVRLVALCLALIFLTNCAQVHLTQGPEEMLVRVGSRDETLWAPPYADNFLAYALIADQTYSDRVYRTKRFDLGDRTLSQGRRALRGSHALRAPDP